jgi:hypothetical protein
VNDDRPLRGGLLDPRGSRRVILAVLDTIQPNSPTFAHAANASGFS